MVIEGDGASHANYVSIPLALVHLKSAAAFTAQENAKVQLVFDRRNLRSSIKSKNNHLIIYTLRLVCGLGMSFLMMFMGIVYIDDCPKQKYVPIFLIVGGCLTTLSSSLMYLNQIRQFDNRYAVCVNNIFNGVTFSWYIYGCIIVYGAYKPLFEVTKQSDLREFCNENLYYFSFWLLNSIFIIIGGCILIVIWLFIMGIIDSMGSYLM